MTDQLNFTNTHAQARAKAIHVAAEVVGTPSYYRQEYTSKGAPTDAPGIMGAIGGQRSGVESTSTYTTYPDALIAVAQYIVTGRTEADDE